MSQHQPFLKHKAQHTEAEGHSGQRDRMRKIKLLGFSRLL